MHDVRRAAVVTLLVGAPLAAQSPATVLDTTRFAPELGVDLARSDRVSSGIYTRDVTVGTGDVLRSAATVTLRLRTLLPDGTRIHGGDDAVTVQWFPGTYVSGVERGLRGMRAGGRRQIVLAPTIGGLYGDRAGVPADRPVVVEVELVAVR